MDGAAGKIAVTGVSPDFAMSRMDDEQHPECDVYVEDQRAATLVAEVLAKINPEFLSRSKIIPFGAASVGTALGQMAANRRFPRPSVVFLDGDQQASLGCNLLPGGDAPEIVVFTALRELNWAGVPDRVGRGPADTIDALNAAMLDPDHHTWPKSVGDRLLVGSDIVWQALASIWAGHVATGEQLSQVANPIGDALP